MDIYLKDYIIRIVELQLFKIFDLLVPCNFYDDIILLLLLENK